jgi:hypothetical protein
MAKAGFTNIEQHYNGSHAEPEDWERLEVARLDGWRGVWAPEYAQQCGCRDVDTSAFMKSDQR